MQTLNRLCIVMYIYSLHREERGVHHLFAKLCCRPFRKIRKPHRPVQGSDLRSTSQLGKTSAGGFVGCFVFLPPAWLRVLFWFQRAWGCCKVGMELFGPEQRVLSMGLSRCQPPTGRQGVCAGPRGTVLDVWKAVPAAYGAASYAPRPKRLRIWRAHRPPDC